MPAGNPRLAAGRARALGLPTRGTTGPNRLRRVDRWMTRTPRVVTALRRAGDPVIVDLGYGHSPVTTMEMALRLRSVRDDLRTVGLELAGERVMAAAHAADPPRLVFRRGGFELAGLRPTLIRAFNVLRQYSEADAATAWRELCARLAPGGLLVEGTCDEVGRRCCWVLLDASGPVSFTLACKPAAIDTPSDLSERLPKALIHRNVPGERIHELFGMLDECWAMAAPHSVFGARARWTESVRLLTTRGWPVLDGRRRWRLGELTVPWSAVAPALAD
ncbi:MAG: class I SAM-dependent methyltransferase [Kutzneria sp.]|nr:class I SAM-dependent methyltransferase [Kutzneria sp.]MBV9845485.1 class I SAM-dependent methyltransferase [Kutzneria sp.]